MPQLDPKFVWKCVGVGFVMGFLLPLWLCVPLSIPAGFAVFRQHYGFWPL